MIHRLSATVPYDDKATTSLRGPLRILAVSDETEPAFDFQRNRDDLLPIDGIVGAGDLHPEYLDFLGEAFKAQHVEHWRLEPGQRTPPALRIGPIAASNRWRRSASRRSLVTKSR